MAHTDTAIPSDRWLSHLRRHLKLTAASGSVEAVHQVRVATRRLDTWLVLGQWGVYRDDLRWLRRTASAVRDLDVIMARRGLPKAFRDRLATRRNAVRRELKDALAADRMAALLAGLALLAPLDRAETEERLLQIKKKSLRRGRLLESTDATIADFHALRRALRRLRYALEWVGHTTKALKELQDVFGITNDAAVLQRHWEAVSPDDRDSVFAREIQADLDKKMGDARKSWIKHRTTVERII